jgi:hypothetical protein
MMPFQRLKRSFEICFRFNHDAIFRKAVIVALRQKVRDKGVSIDGEFNHRLRHQALYFEILNDLEGGKISDWDIYNSSGLGLLSIDERISRMQGGAEDVGDGVLPRCCLRGDAYNVIFDLERRQELGVFAYVSLIDEVINGYYHVVSPLITAANIEELRQYLTVFLKGLGELNKFQGKWDGVKAFE